MMSDQEAIRTVINEWLIASKAGNLEKLLSLMTDDVLFITRNGNMRRDDFVASFKSMSGKVEIDGKPEIQEITVEGALAICWNKLDISIKPSGGNTIRQAGDILSVFRRGEDGRWRLWRDANLLAPV